MGHSQRSKLETHGRILEAASVRLRERGLEGIGVADLMKEAGLTVGGFYKHFASKDELLARAIETMANGWAEVFAQGDELAPGALFDALVDSYLAPEHRDHPGSGCLFAALSSEIGRSEDVVRTAATERLGAVLRRLTAVFPDRRAPAARAAAILTYAACVGAVSLARATNDEALSREILATVAKGLKRALRPG